VTNISTKAYGNKDMGEIEVHVWADPFIKFALPQQGQEYSHQDRLCVLPVKDIQANNGSWTFNLPYQLDGASGSKLFELVHWKVELRLRGRVIQYHTGAVRVTPVFLPFAHSDCILLTNKQITRDEFIAWSYLLQLLGLSVNFWDLERYQEQFFHKDFTWVGLAPLVIWPGYCVSSLFSSLLFPLFSL
jgi:hypothetical protein